MTTKAYYTKEVVRDFIARVMKEAGMLGVTFSQGCQIHPDRLEASAESMTKLMNWICYSRVEDRGDSVQEAKSYAAHAVEDLIKHPTRKFKLNAEWRQFSWWALRVIACTESEALTSKDEWEQWVKDHNLTGQRTAPEYNADRDRDAPDGERDEGDESEGEQPERGGQPDDKEGDGDGDGESEGEQPEEGEDGEPGEGKNPEGEPDGEPEEGDGGDAGDGKGEDEPEEQDEDGPKDDDTPPMPPIPPVPPTPPEEDEEKEEEEELKDEKSLTGFVWRILRYGMTKVRMDYDDGEVVSALLMGLAGIGKTSAVKRQAKKLGAKVFVITAGQRPSDYLGFRDATGNYHASPMIEAIWYAQQHPDQMVVILFDELDMTPADTSGVLYSLFASRDLETLLTGKVDCPKNLVLFAAMNTFGDGANDDFAGRTPVDKAMLDRFAFPFVAEFEEKVARRICKDSDFVDLVLDWNQACMESGMTKAVLSYRAINGFRMALDAGFPLNYALGKIVMGQTRDALDTIWDCMKGNRNRKYWKLLKECIQAVPETR